MTKPSGTTLHLVSNIDRVISSLALSLEPGPDARLVLVETAMLAEGRRLDAAAGLPFEAHGFTVEVCDLAQEAPEDLARRLEGARGIVLMGGNTFTLMEALDDIGFDEIVRARAEKGPFHVIGESAGAVVMGSRITHVASMDDPLAANRVVEAGLGWIDARVLPHRNCPDYGFGEAVERLLQSDDNPEDFLVIDEVEWHSIAALEDEIISMTNYPEPPHNLIDGVARAKASPDRFQIPSPLLINEMGITSRSD